MADDTTSLQRAERVLYVGSASLASSVVADGALEHFRAGAYNPVMLVGPAVAAATLASSARAAAGSVKSRRCRNLYLVAILGGFIGTAFHTRNVIRREGGLRMLNLFYGAPVGAPLGLTLAGVFGHFAETDAVKSHPRLLGLIATAGLAGTAAEAGMLHFRGSFHHPLMFAPAILPPLAAASLAMALLRPTRRRLRVGRLLLRATATLGLAGVAAHANGIRRSMGGWRNWSQNLFAGPPVPAPPAFTGIALAGLAALASMGRRR